MTNPPETEIWSGYSLNTLLANLQQLAGKGVEGPTVALDPASLKQINVTVKGQGNVGLLKERGKLNWPFALPHWRTANTFAARSMHYWSRRRNRPPVAKLMPMC